MREIIFRGKDKVHGKWIYGYYAELNGKCVIIPIYPEFYPELINIIFDGVSICEIDPETLCQFIELRDDCGDEIYEGDILLLRDKINNLEWTAVVEFGNPNGNYTWGFDLKKITGEVEITDILLWVDTQMPNQASYEIIGNIFDNPELIEN